MDTIMKGYQKRGRWLVGVISLLCCITLFGGLTGRLSLTVKAAEKTEGDYVYTLSDDGKTAVIMKYTGKENNIKLPEKLGGKPVSDIGAEAFMENENLLTVTLPKGIKTIGKNAFKSCNALTAVTLPEGLTDIEEYAFWYCKKLTAITFPKSLRYIGSYAFKNCESLTKADLPEGLETVGGWAFEECKSLSEIRCPDSVQIVGSGAFDYTGWYNNHPDGDMLLGQCYYKYKGTMPDNYEVTVGEDVQLIADGAFSDRTTLTQITMPMHITRIGNNLFYCCTHLTEINLPQQLVTVGDRAFYRCEGLKSIVFPDCTESIGQEALSECLTLTRVVLPHSLRSIGEDAFVGCYQLSDVIYIGTKEDFDAIEMTDKTRELLLAKITFVTSSDAVPDVLNSSPNNRSGSQNQTQRTQNRGAAAVIQEENKVWTIVIIAGVAFIVVMLIAFVVRAILSRKKPAPVQEPPSASPVPPVTQMPRWRNAPSSSADTASSTDTEKPVETESSTDTEEPPKDTEA